ncbi:MAG: hypothetical protein NHB15_08540 [Methanosarcina barkeri]|nr:hypothetical protein [Methanosarcina sp. ERenArc_MAG2]
MSDLGNPMHTGCEYDQYQNPRVHTFYESYVYNNWDVRQKSGDAVGMAYVRQQNTIRGL